MYEIVVISIVAAILTYELNVNRGFGSVKASAAVCLLFGMLCLLLSAGSVLDQKSAEIIPLAAMGASFAGMSSKKVIPNIWWMGFAGAIFSFIFLFSSPMFVGLGGGLGLTACIAVVSTLGVMKISKIVF